MCYGVTTGFTAFLRDWLWRWDAESSLLVTNSCIMWNRIMSFSEDVQRAIELRGDKSVRFPEINDSVLGSAARQPYNFRYFNLNFDHIVRTWYFSNLCFAQFAL